MSINFEKAFGTYETALQLRTRRAEVLSSNLANADTPNYKARDFDFQSALNSALGTPGDIERTKPQHFSSSAGSTPDGIPLSYRTPAQPSIDGNTVDEHIEHAEFMRNSLEFQATFTLLNSRMKGLISAIKGE